MLELHCNNNDRKKTFKKIMRPTGCVHHIVVKGTIHLAMEVNTNNR